MILFYLGLFFLTLAQDPKPIVEQKQKVTIEDIKKSISEKNIAQAINQLNKHPEILKPVANQKDIAQWLALFQLESSLILYEKAQEKFLAGTAEYASAEEDLLKIISQEPYNTQANTTLIALWLTQDKNSLAEENIKKLRLTIPFLPIYTLYEKATMPTSKSKTSIVSHCESSLLRPPEKEFCNYLKIREKILSATSLKPELKKIGSKPQIPEVYFLLWKKFKNKDYKQKYVSSCRDLSDKQRKSYHLIPGICSHGEHGSDDDDDEADRKKD